MRTIIALTMLLVMLTVPAHAKLKTIGQVDHQEFDQSSFPQKMKEAYSLMKSKCLVCHTMERTVMAVTTGIAPISSTVFDKSAARTYCNKMLKKPNANMSKQDVKIIVDLLNYLLDQAAK
ncbi:cytochrome C [Geobacter argillaceus]|uniref:Cytochrome c domain-containing protein n=1 Tax=Geobacter argillaceus TaxID=345631 RepID=A0A562V839_9BACT|nr:cytochrome C [Geobacter argillaceus]TWJ14060.1 hypothetical protein JN12_03559 [Geobacter argillaceus]